MFWEGSERVSWQSRQIYFVHKFSSRFRPLALFNTDARHYYSVTTKLCDNSCVVLTLRCTPHAAWRRCLHLWLCWRRCWQSGAVLFGWMLTSSLVLGDRPDLWSLRLFFLLWQLFPLTLCSLLAGLQDGLLAQLTQVKTHQHYRLCFHEDVYYYCSFLIPDTASLQSAIKVLFSTRPLKL